MFIHGGDQEVDQWAHLWGQRGAGGETGQKGSGGGEEGQEQEGGQIIISWGETASCPGVSQNL